jgi:hypothetical protein
LECVLLFLFHLLSSTSWGVCFLLYHLLKNLDAIALLQSGLFCFAYSIPLF